MFLIIKLKSVLKCQGVGLSDFEGGGEKRGVSWFILRRQGMAAWASSLWGVVTTEASYLAEDLGVCFIFNVERKKE